MPTLTTPQPPRTDTPGPVSDRLASRFRESMAAARLSFTWFGSRKSLTTEQKSQAAVAFNAASDYLSAHKKLIDTSHPAMKGVTAVRGQIQHYWRSISLPFPEPGIRLIRREEVSSFHERMSVFREELATAVDTLENGYAELRANAAKRLGQLFSPTDYPTSLRGAFDVSWDWPTMDAPPYLQQLSPQLYEEECTRVQAQFREAIELAEQAFFEEFSKLLEHLTERLTGEADGKPKVFRDSAVDNLQEFFQRFQNLRIGSNEQLDELVTQAQQIVRGIAPQQLRDNSAVRQQIASQLSGVQSVLDGLLVDRPRRNILRRPR